MKKSFTILSIPAFVILFTGALIASGGGGSKHESRFPNQAITTLGNNSGPQINPLAIIFHDDMDGLNDTTALKARGYKVYYRGTGPQGSTATWYQGAPTTFSAYAGPADGYVASNYNSVTNVNTIDNWLVLPALDITAGDTLSFYAQSVVSSFVDSVRVMYSAAGDTVPEAASWVELGRIQVNKGAWQLYDFIATASGTDARFAIRYRVADAGPLGNNSDYIGIDEITVHGTPQFTCPVTSVPMATSGSNCGTGSVSLSATTGGTNTYIVWMDSTGNVLGSGNTFATPVISSTTTFYVADADTIGTSAHVGPDTSIATGTFPGSNFSNGLFFTAISDMRIDSIHLYSNGALSGNFQISDTAGGAVFATAPFSIPGAGYHQVYVGIDLTAGDYFINVGSLSGSGVLFRTLTGATFPYTEPGLVSITGANIADPLRYYYFFDWTVSPICFGPQVPVVATILPANNTLPFFEDFENGLPCNWSTSQAPTSFGWQWGDSASMSSSNWMIPAHSNFMVSNDDSCNCDMSMDYLISPVFDFSNYSSLTNITLNFEAYYDSTYGSSAYVEVSIDSGLTWNIVHTLSPSFAWQNVIVDLSAYAGQPAVQIAFHHDDNTDWADGFAVDDVLITAVCSGEEITVNLLTDIYGTEISWSIVDVNTGITYGMAGPFEDLSPYSVAAATYNMTVCVPLGATLEWRIEDSFGDGLFDGTNSGNYSVIGPCGEIISSGGPAFSFGGGTANPPAYDSLVFTIQPPMIDLGADTIMCEGSTLVLTSNLPNVTWSNGQTTQSITINNDTPGTYEYFVSTPGGNCFATDTITVTVNPLPVPDFSASINVGAVTFTNASANATSYHWSFGTGDPADTSNAADPTFTYTANGTYTVVLTATNACGSVSHTFDVVITGIVGITEIPGATINISPNPASNNVNIAISGLAGQEVILSVSNLLGQEVFADRLLLSGNDSKKVDVNSFNKGIYFITIKTENHSSTRKLVVE